MPRFARNSEIGEQGLGTVAHTMCNLGGILRVDKEGGGACKSLYNKMLGCYSIIAVDGRVLWPVLCNHYD